MEESDERLFKISVDEYSLRNGNVRFESSRLPIEDKGFAYILAATIAKDYGIHLSWKHESMGEDSESLSYIIYEAEVTKDKYNQTKEVFEKAVNEFERSIINLIKTARRS